MMQKPPRGSDGLVVPHDSPDIDDDHEVIRRISEHFIVHDSCGNPRISSMAYQPSSNKGGGMSIDLKYLIEQDNKDPKEYVTTPRWMGSVIFKAADFRGLDFQVGYDPVDYPEPNPYHGQVWGQFSKGKIKKLQEIAEWFVPIKNVSLTVGQNISYKNQMIK